MGSVNSTVLLLRESSRQSGNKSRKSRFIRWRVMFRGAQLFFLRFSIRSADRDFEILIIRFRFSLYANLRDYWINSVCSNRMAFQSNIQAGLCTGASLVNLQYNMKTSFVNLSSPSLSGRVRPFDNIIFCIKRGPNLCFHIIDLVYHTLLNYERSIL